MSKICLSHVEKRYDNGKLILEDFNLEIFDGEFLVLVGPSGCGKTTTLRLIAGLEELTSGELYIGDQKVNRISPGKRDIAMVFQDYALYPNMSVYENMAFGLRNQKMEKEKIQQRIEKVANRLEIQPFLKRKPRALSGGQRQRVALGRAMVRDSSVFLLDEPLSNLDAQLRSNMRVEISLLHQELQSTFVYVTHDQTEAMTMADRIVIMNEGKILQIGTPDEIYHKPANQFVAGFIGSPKMNFFNAIPTFNGTQKGFTIGSFFIPFSTLSEKIMEIPLLTIGIRPENFSIVAVNEACLHGTIRYIEKLGPENYIHLAVDEKMVVVRTIASSFYLSQTIGLSFSLDKIHFFKENTGERITL